MTASMLDRPEFLTSLHMEVVGDESCHTVVFIPQLDAIATEFKLAPVSDIEIDYPDLVQIIEGREESRQRLRPF